MLPLVSDAQFNSVAAVIIAVVTITPTTLAAVWSRQAKTMGAQAVREVQSNGGMQDPNPNMNDHIKYQTELLEELRGTVATIGSSLIDVDERFSEHLAESQMMNEAFAKLYLKVEKHLPPSDQD